MGKPKLTLPVGGEPLIVRVVSALKEGGLDHVLVVTPPIGAAGSRELGEEAGKAGATILVTETRPADMRASVELALTRIEAAFPGTTGIIMTPADAPGVTASLVERLLKTARGHPKSIVAPVFAGKRGHPIVIPWMLAAEIPSLPANVGINALLKRHENAVLEIEADDDGILEDLDTPDDYTRWNERIQSKPRNIIVSDDIT